jgi:hypothetical protein
VDLDNGDVRVPENRQPAGGRRHARRRPRHLEPIWFEKAETARRVLQRMELVFKSTIVLGQREKASPCVGIRQQLGIRHLDVEHLRALPYETNSRLHSARYAGLHRLIPARQAEI